MVAGLTHVYVEAPEAVIVVVAPLHIDVEPEIEIVGVGLAVIP